MKKILSILTLRATLFVALLTFALAVNSAQAQEVKQSIREALDRGDTANAIIQLTKEVELDKTYHLNYSLLGQIYFRLGQYERAQTFLDQAFEKKKKDVETVYYLGRTLVELGDLDRAEKLLDEGRKKAKDKEKGMLEDGYGMVMMAKQNYQEADRAFRQALIVDGDNPLYHIHLGNANFRQGIPSLAVSEYEKALEKDTAGTEVYYNWAEACLGMKDYNCAIEKLRVVLQKDSLYASAWNRAGGIYFKAAMNPGVGREDKAARFKDAIGSYRRYLELSGAKADSSTVRAYFELAMSYLNLSGFEEAVKYFEDVLAIPYTPKDIYYNYGKALWGAKQFDKGAEMLKKHQEWVTQQGPGYKSPISPSEMYSFMGDTYYYQKPPDYIHAIENYKEVLKIDSTRKRELQNVAFAYHMMKSNPQAMYYYQKRIAMGIDSAASSIYKNAGLCAMALAGNAANEEGQPAADSSAPVQLASTEVVTFDPNINWNQVAAEYFEEFLKYNPTDAKVVQMLGTTYLFTLKNCTEGIKQFERLLQLDPNDCVAKRSLGYAYFAGGEVGCPKNISKSLDYLVDAYNCVSKTQGGCKDASLVLWIAQAYHTRAAERVKEDKAASKADFGQAYDWYGKVLQCQPGNKEAKKGQDDTYFER
jgi:tetratricopeptide (TPR) repeat protein